MEIELGLHTVCHRLGRSNLGLADGARRFHINDDAMICVDQVPKGDKATRLKSVSPAIEAGRVLIPNEAPWLAEFQRELTLFPNARNDDQIDSLSQLLTWLEQPQFEWYVGGKSFATQ